LSLSYAYLSINIISLAVIAAGIVAVVFRRDKTNSRELFLALFFIFIGSFSIFMESVVPGFENKLLWRNLSQIGLFLLPSASFNFIMVYSRTENRFLNIARRLNFIYAGLCVIFIFTNDLHHIMRISVDFVQNDIGMVLSVRQTLTGKICVALNTLISLSSMVRLWVFLRATSKNSRSQVRLVLTGFLVPIIFTYTRSAILTALGILIPTPLSFMIGILFILWGMYRYDLLAVSPVAREWVIDEINIGMILTRPDGEVADANRFVLEHFDNSIEQVKDFLESESSWHSAVIDHRNEQIEVEWSRGSERKIFAVRVHNLRKKRHSLGTVSLLTDITAEKHLHKNLLRRAETDSMTKILNREAFVGRMSGILAEKQDTDKSCSLFIIDIDNFKQINDSYGHMTGDEVIREIVTIINNISRQQDYVGRLGGDEFIMFLYDIDDDSSAGIAERINENIDSREFTSGGRRFRVSLSIGIVNAGIKGSSFEDLYRQADEALFKAKQGGKSRFCFYREGVPF